MVLKQVLQRIEKNSNIAPGNEVCLRFNSIVNDQETENSRLIQSLAVSATRLGVSHCEYPENQFTNEEVQFHCADKVAHS